MNFPSPPNLLTWSRIVACPVLVAVFLSPLPDGARNLVAAAVFIVAALSDFADGYLARKFNRQSRFGAFLDPVADKIIVVTSLLLLADAGRAPLVAAIIIICREICISALREWMADIGARQKIKVSTLGKWKTAAQFVAIALLFYGGDIFSMDAWLLGKRFAFSTDALFLGKWLLWLSAFLTVLSMIKYLRAAVPLMGAEK